MLSMLIFAAVAVFPIVVAVAACYDLLTMTIPNAVSLILIASFAALAVLLAPGWTVVGWHVGVGLCAFVVMFALFAFGVIGGGDAKMATAVCLWLGPSQMAAFLVYTAVFGGALSLVILLFRAMPLPPFAMRQDWLVRLHEPRGGIPYGIALAAGALLVFPATPWFRVLAA